MPAGAPGAQRVAVNRLDLDDLCAEIGEQNGDLVASNKTGEVEHANTVKRAGGVSGEVFKGDQWACDPVPGNLFQELLPFT